MKTITMYELLGMVKDGKAPKKIKFNNDEWYWGYDTYIPYSFLNNTPDVQIGVSLFHRYRIDYCLNKEVEILEEEKKIPEKIKYYDDSIAWVIDDVGQLSDVDKVIIDKLNDVIDYFKSKGE